MELMSTSHHRVYKDNNRVIKIGMYNSWVGETECYLFNRYNNIPSHLNKAFIDNGDLNMPNLGEPIQNFNYLKAIQFLHKVHTDKNIMKNKNLIFDKESHYNDLKNRIERRIRKTDKDYSYFMNILETYKHIWEQLDSRPKVFIHGDIHEKNWVCDNNTINENSNYYLIDWETYQLAPVELEYAVWYVFNEFYHTNFDKNIILNHSSYPIHKETLTNAILFKMVGSLSFTHKRIPEDFERTKNILNNFITNNY